MAKCKKTCAEKARRVFIGVPAVMLLFIAGLFCCQLASVGYSAISKVWVKDARGGVARVYSPYQKQVMNGEQVAYFFAYSFAASLLAASGTYALKSCSKVGSSCSVTPPPAE